MFETHEDSRRLPRLSTKYNFKKPNDRRALDLMNAVAMEIMNEFPAIILGYGMSDEYRCHIQIRRRILVIMTANMPTCSFVFDRSCTIFERREMYDIITHSLIMKIGRISFAQMISLGKLSPALFPPLQLIMSVCGHRIFHRYHYQAPCPRLMAERCNTQL